MTPFLKQFSIQLVLSFVIQIGHTQGCPDELRQQIYDQCVVPYFQNLNSLVKIGDNFENSDKFRIWKSLFVKEDDRYLPTDFIPMDQMANIKMPSDLPVGTYIVELQTHWGSSLDQDIRFHLPRPNEVFSTRYNEWFIVVFEKTISGTFKDDNSELFEDVFSSVWIEFKLNSNLKIDQVRINKTKPIDNDQDNIIDFYTGKLTDLSPKSGFLKFSGRPDSDCDGVEDEKDRCVSVGIKNKVTIDGCPDRDKDGVEDDKDQAPDSAGTKKCKGANDSDDDGKCDYEDDCPEIAGRRKDGCLLPLKPFIISIKPYYFSAIPLGILNKKNPLTGSSFEWTEKAGFATWGALNGGISLEILPTRNIGFGIDAFYWSMPFDSELFGRLLNTYYSRRVLDFESANASASSYNGLGILAKLPFGFFQRRFAISMEPCLGYLFTKQFENDLSTLIVLRNATDVSGNINLLPEKIPVFGMNMLFSKQFLVADKHFGLEFRLSYLKGSFRTEFDALDLFLDVPPIPFGSLPFDMLSLGLSLKLAFWEPNNNNQ